ncbi:MAG: cytochrome c3 family protein [Desulfobacterales bacterium]|nr:MAG: cytochrome c3 family protein [Desulfobacterales bacterium]
MKTNIILVLLTLITILASAAFIYVFWVWPVRAIGPEQPIPFSHNVHSGVKQIQCQYCHPYVAYSNFPGIPPVEKCLHCHNYIIKQHPQIQKEHKYFNTQTPTPWVKVNYVAEHVLFNHQRHINGKIACRECHGEVENLQRLPHKDWRMGICIECHKKKNANVDCWLACHS